MPSKRRGFEINIPLNSSKIMFNAEVSKFTTDGEPDFKTFSAIIDTGATITCVSPSIAAKLGLEQIGLMRVAGVHNSTEDCPLYSAEIRLDGGIVLDQSVVGAKPAGSDILIGMDLLSRGDFSLSHNKNGEMIFSFIYPPLGEPVSLIKIAKITERAVRKKNK